MKAVIFDFNGTLFDDTRFHLEAWRRFIRDKLHVEFSEQELRRRFLGPNNSQILPAIFGESLTEEESEALSREKEALYRAVVRSDPENLRLMDGAPELFDLLVERDIPFALATASILDNVNFYLEELNLKKWFTLDRIVYDEGKLPSKPDPAFYLEAMRRLNVRGQDCIIAEDSIFGIRAAAAAGAGRIVAIDRTLSRERLLSQKEIYAVAHDFHGFENFL